MARPCAGQLPRGVQKAIKIASETLIEDLIRVRLIPSTIFRVRQEHQPIDMVSKPHAGELLPVARFQCPPQARHRQWCSGTMRACSTVTELAFSSVRGNEAKRYKENKRALFRCSARSPSPALSGAVSSVSRKCALSARLVLMQLFMDEPWERDTKNFVMPVERDRHQRLVTWV